VFAAIDVGSNTVRLLLGHAINGRVEPFCYERRITRLKGGATSSGLAPEAMARTLAALQEFALLIQQAQPVACRAVGTAALRQAANAQAFLHTVTAETGIAIETITGEEEARLSGLGVMTALLPVPESCLVVDIGGGSTEFALIENGCVLFQTSTPLGVVTLAETCHSAESLKNTISALLDPIFTLLSDACPCPLSKLDLVGTAGTVTTLAAMHLQMTCYDWRLINNCRLTATDLSQLQAQLHALSPIERELLPGMETGRGDLILPGIDILQSIMARIAAPTVIVSDFGLLEGVLCDLAVQSDANN